MNWMLICILYCQFYYCLLYTSGNSRLILSESAKLGTLKASSDGSIAVVEGENNNLIYWNGKEKTELAANASQVVFRDNKNILYLADNNGENNTLYYYNGKNNQKLIEGVNFIAVSYTHLNSIMAI